MNNSIRPYLFEAMSLIRSNLSLLFIPTIIAFIPYLSLFSPKNPLGGLIVIFSRISLFILYPLIYGRFIAIINGYNTLSWGQLFSLHWLNYFIVRIVLYVPILILLFVYMIFNLNNKFIIGITSILIDVLAIYILPIVFLDHVRLKSIPFGLKCLLGNFKFSLPLIFISILPILFSFLPSLTSGHSYFPLYYFFIALPQWIFALVIDFTVFISASLILKDKLYRN
jgi:hypothetical protein